MRQEQLLPLHPALLDLAEHVAADRAVHRAEDAVVLLLLHREVGPQDLLERVLLRGLLERVVGRVLVDRLDERRLPGQLLDLVVGLRDAGSGSRPTLPLLSATRWLHAVQVRTFAGLAGPASRTRGSSEIAGTAGAPRTCRRPRTRRPRGRLRRAASRSVVEARGGHREAERARRNAPSGVERPARRGSRSPRRTPRGRPRRRARRISSQLVRAAPSGGDRVRREAAQPAADVAVDGLGAASSDEHDLAERERVRVVADVGAQPGHPRHALQAALERDHAARRSAQDGRGRRACACARSRSSTHARAGRPDLRASPSGGTSAAELAARAGRRRRACGRPRPRGRGWRAGCRPSTTLLPSTSATSSARTPVGGAAPSSQATAARRARCSAHVGVGSSSGALRARLPAPPQRYNGAAPRRQSHQARRRSSRDARGAAQAAARIRGTRRLASSRFHAPRSSSPVGVWTHAHRASGSSDGHHRLAQPARRARSRARTMPGASDAGSSGPG